MTFYQKKYVNNYIKVESGERIAFLLIEFPEKYLCWCYDSRVEQQQATNKEFSYQNNDKI
jgi:hypothetical protein